MKKFLFLGVFMLIIAGCGNNTTNEATTNNNVIENEINNESESKLTIPVNTSQSEETTSEKLNINQEENIMSKAKIETSLGNIVVELNSEKAPISVENFKAYANSGFYDGTIFHRVIPGFMIQGGGFDADETQKSTNAEIKNEAKNGLKNDRGTLAMARTNVVDSATSQFFINLVDNDFLNYQDDNNYGYAVFGKVVEGMDVVDKIAEVQTGNNGPHQNWPVENVVIKKVELMK